MARYFKGRAGGGGSAPGHANKYKIKCENRRNHQECGRGRNDGWRLIGIQSGFPHYYPQSTLINLMLQGAATLTGHYGAQRRGRVAALDLGEINIGGEREKAAAAASERVPGGDFVF